MVVIGGAFLTALIYRPFSIALADGLGPGWAVDVYDRRGRGSSTPQPPGYSMATEIADVRTVMDATGARNILGHSLGGSVALNAVQEFTGTRVRSGQARRVRRRGEHRREHRHRLAGRVRGGRSTTGSWAMPWRMRNGRSVPDRRWPVSPSPSWPD